MNKNQILVEQMNQLTSEVKTMNLLIWKTLTSIITKKTSCI